MKKKLWKGILLYTILIHVSVHTGAKAYYGINKNSAVKFFYTSGMHVNDTLEIQNTAKNILVPANIKLQSIIRKFVADYILENSEMLEDVKQKNNNSFITIERILEEKGIPVQLKYLAVIESKLKNNATSGVGAAGVWQLMPVTARSLGLKVNGKTDERRHLYKSSAAAAKYLNELYNEFDDWLLVVAAYNCGAGNVYKAIKKSGSRDFWKLQFFLPAETRKHVKKFIATHYYYEENGSLVTLTKYERKKHLTAINEVIEKEQEPEMQSLLPAGKNLFNWIAISIEGDKIIFEPRK